MKKAAAKKASAIPHDPFRRRKGSELDALEKGHAHVYGNHVRCETDKLGFATPRNRSRTEIVVDSSEGFIPLWAKGMTLRWRFQEEALTQFEDAEAAKKAIRELLAEGVLAWGEAAPVKLAERKDNWDFEIAVRKTKNCDAEGCVLASAFFPDAGQHKLRLYPTLFEQTRKEQVSTLAHEIGHMFGLRHFFAKIEEKEWRSEIFGAHKPFSIMNYGAKSKLTATDKKDLARLYAMVWSGELTEINGTRIKQVRPFHLS